MRKFILTTALAFISSIGFAQNDAGFGIKGGLNYGANGDYFEAVQAAYNNTNNNIGYHLGIFTRFGEKIYFRPELVYTKTKSDYASNSLDMNKLDAPLLIGFNAIGPLNIFAGPALQYILDADFSGSTFGDVEKEVSVGLQIGVGVAFGNMGIDLRYERGFTENEITQITSTTLKDRIDTRPNQLILCFSLKL